MRLEEQEFHAIHAYGGFEHDQPGPFSECLLCRIAAADEGIRAWVEDGDASRLSAYYVQFLAIPEEPKEVAA